MLENQGFEITVNGFPRTYRDNEGIALDAARNLKRNNLGGEITVINRATKEWFILTDASATEVIWRPAPGVAAVEIT